MENASKALIIAGAILIAILLITVGVMVMRSIDPMKEAAEKNSKSMAVQTFNAQFTSYVGDGQNAANVRALINVVGASNAQNPDHQVTIKMGSTDLLTDTKKITSTGSYTVSSAQTDGYISALTVTKK